MRSSVISSPLINMLRMVVLTALLLLIGCQSKPHDYLNESNPLAFAVHLYAQVLVNSCTSHDFKKFAEHVMTENLFKNLMDTYEIAEEEELCFSGGDLFTGSQELVTGFLIDSVEEKGDFAVVGVSTGMMDVKSIKSPALYLHLARISGRWRLSDIVYVCVHDKSLTNLHSEIFQFRLRTKS